LGLFASTGSQRVIDHSPILRGGKEGQKGEIYKVKDLIRIFVKSVGSGEEGDRKVE